MKGPSQHFSWTEFACNDGTPYPAAWRNTRAKRLASVLEGLRAYVGGFPLELGSVFRTPVWNRQNGGASKSQHPQGKAADPHPPKGMRAARFRKKVREYAKLDKRIGGLGLYRWGAHVDIRARVNGRLVVWNQVPAGTRLHDRKAHSPT